MLDEIGQLRRRVPRPECSKGGNGYGCPMLSEAKVGSAVSQLV